MQPSSSPIDLMLATFEHNSDNNTPANTASLFADTFLAAGTDGTVCLRASDFARILPARQARFREAGCTSTKLAAREDIRLDDRYTLLRTKWRFDFALEGESVNPIVAETTFLVEIATPEPKIVVYIAHQDVLKILAESGKPDEPAVFYKSNMQSPSLKNRYRSATARRVAIE